jgi:hypothetical protein
LYMYQDFKTFSVSQEGGAISVIFMPLKRFMPPLTMYVSPDVGDNVVTFLSAFLPFEHHQPDMVETLMRRIRL